MPDRMIGGQGSVAGIVGNPAIRRGYALSPLMSRLLLPPRELLKLGNYAVGISLLLPLHLGHLLACQKFMVATREFTHLQARTDLLEAACPLGVSTLPLPVSHSLSPYSLRDLWVLVRSLPAGRVS